MDALGLILETFAPIAGRRLIDIGCGPGVLAKALAARGAAIVGVDPGADALRAARVRAPGAGFVQASAEALPFSTGSFDGAVILNALHHVPDPAAALREAARVVRSGAAVVVVEPLAEGSFFAALQPVEDETAVRAGAQAAIAAALAQGSLRCLRDVTFTRRETFADLAAFLDRVAAVDPARRAAIRDNRAPIEAAFRRAGRAEADGGRTLVQPLRAHVLAGAASA